MWHYMSRWQTYIQALPRVIRHLEIEPIILQGIVEQLTQDKTQDVIFVETDAIFDDWHIHFVFPPHLLAQELKVDALEHLQLIPVTPQPNRRQLIAEARQRACKWVKCTYGTDGWRCRWYIMAEFVHSFLWSYDQYCLWYMGYSIRTSQYMSRSWSLVAEWMASQPGWWYHTAAC